MSNVSSKWVMRSYSENFLTVRCIDLFRNDSVSGANASERWNRFATDVFLIDDQRNANFSAENNSLTVESKRPSDSEEQSSYYTRGEWSNGVDPCAFSWPVFVIEDKLTSIFTVGGLQIHIPARSIENAPSSIKEA